MKNYLISTILLILFVVSAGHSHSWQAGGAPEVPTSLSGQVIDQNTNESLAGVRVEIQGTDLVAYTDFDGNFRFENLNNPDLVICFSYTSYQEHTISVKADRLNTLQVKLSKR